MAGIIVNEELMFELISDYAKKYNTIPETNKQAIQWAYEKGYAKAIDEFAERLKRNYQAYDIDLCLQDNEHLSYTNSCIALESYIDQIAEQMKAGGING